MDLCLWANLNLSEFISISWLYSSFMWRDVGYSWLSRHCWPSSSKYREIYRNLRNLKVLSRLYLRCLIEMHYQDQDVISQLICVESAVPTQQSTLRGVVAKLAFGLRRGVSVKKEV